MKRVIEAENGLLSSLIEACRVNGGMFIGVSGSTTSDEHELLFDIIDGDCLFRYKITVNESMNVVGIVTARVE